jgi:hypothetical protein
VAEALVPQLLGDGGEVGVRGWSHDWVQIAIRVTAQDHPLCLPILNRETTSIKFNVNWIVTTQGFDRYEVFDKVGRNKNVAEKNGRGCSGKVLMSSVRDRERRSVAHYNARGRTRSEGGEITGRGGHVG